MQLSIVPPACDEEGNVERYVQRGVRPGDVPKPLRSLVRIRRRLARLTGSGLVLTHAMCQYKT